ncbi:MAG: futalosine hydrolase [Desulfuromonas sp.]|nr:MAG: futalosine hydrolase [Desulfuromonas sp.]
MLAIITPTGLEAAELLPLLTEKRALPGNYSLTRGQIGGCPIVLLTCGIGKTNAAAASATLLQQLPISRVVMLGCGGAYLGSDLRVGDLAVATAEIHGDEGCETRDGFLDMEALQLPVRKGLGGTCDYNRFPVAPTSPECRALLQRFGVNCGVRVGFGPFVTVSRCSGLTSLGAELEQRTGGICENMEGAAVAQICVRFDIPFHEIRGISNLVEDRNTRRWDIPVAARIAQQALLDLLASGFGEEAT